MDKTATHLDLFSGIGGFALAARWAGFRTVAFCEIDKYCQKVLPKNFGAILGATSTSRGNWTTANGVAATHDAPRKLAYTKSLRESQSERFKPNERRWISNSGDESGSQPNRPLLLPDIFALDGRDFAGVSLITGGFPCQPFSVAGKRGGASDDRAIWPQMFRVISEARPAWVLGENVPGIIPMELDNVLSDLEGIGYATRAFVIPACAVDARHRRDRLWIIGRRIICDSEHAGLDAAEVSGSVTQGGDSGEAWAQQASEFTRSGEQSKELADANGPGSQGWDGAELPERASERTSWKGDTSVADTDRRRREQRNQSERGFSEFDACRWQPEPDVGRVAHGIPSRVDKLKGLGNAIVPQVAYEILREIRKLT